MPALLHISDLHRTSQPRLSNDELLAAVVSDAGRWELGGISRPDLVVVSGDLIQGASAESTDPDSEIEAQYAEAGHFLMKLAAEFVESDRSRVVIVPGNHDVHWGPCEKCDEAARRLPRQDRQRDLRGQFRGALGLEEAAGLRNLRQWCL